MNRHLKFISVSIAAVVIALIVVIAALSLNAAPHFAFPSYQQVNSASGSSYSGEKYMNSSGGSATGGGIVKVEAMNYSSGNTFLDIGIALYNTSNDAVSAYVSVNSSIARIVILVPGAVSAHAEFKGYSYAYVIMPHNVTLSGITLQLGGSLAVCRLSNYVVFMYSNFAGLNAAKMTNLIELQINVMTGGPLP